MKRILLLTALLVAPSLVSSLEAASRGITADGRVITMPHGITPIWRDIIRMVKPTYPLSLRASHPKATGFYRVVLNVRTGRVRAVVIQQSSGYKAIDDNITAALRRWQLKPNRWREFEMPVTIAYDPNG